MKKRIAIIGDSMVDEWIHGVQKPSQDGCLKFLIEKVVRTPGGAANAARSLEEMDAHVRLYSFCDDGSRTTPDCCPVNGFPVKTRYLENGKIVFRADKEVPNYGLNRAFLCNYRDYVVKSISSKDYDAVYVSDYAKGLLEDETIVRLIEVCQEKDIPIVVDPKRPPECCRGAVIKCNSDYSQQHFHEFHGYETMVITNGRINPTIVPKGFDERDYPHVRCLNHVGAGDCFGAHLTLGLSHGLPLPEAARLAHAAGRVYVQHLHNRPPQARGNPGRWHLLLDFQRTHRYTCNMQSKHIGAVQAAKILGCTREWVRQLVIKGILPGQWIGEMRVLSVCERDVLRLAERRELEKATAGK